MENTAPVTEVKKLIQSTKKPDSLVENHEFSQEIYKLLLNRDAESAEIFRLLWQELVFSRKVESFWIELVETQEVLIEKLSGSPQTSTKAQLAFNPLSKEQDPSWNFQNETSESHIIHTVGIRNQDVKPQELAIING